MSGRTERNTATAPLDAWDLLRREAARRGVPLALVTAEAIEEKAARIRDGLPPPKLVPGRGSRSTRPGETSEPVAGAHR